ncbi:MAG: isoprenylcysteine carboxylmethyltransferase family protein [Armatimonadetes bacterium]|nr:isoprenylcysteine carboxylmethyltransferase family protein [Armatimonadota bacterium]
MDSKAWSSIEDSLHRTLTWYRVPLMGIATVALVGFITSKSAFWVGAPVALLGELVQIWAASHLHKDERLTVSGPYSHVRNPMYIGRLLLGLGFFLMTWNPYLIGGYVCLFAVYAHFRVRREEKRLNEIFQPDYQKYCSEIRRWIPSFKPYSGSESRRASWKQVCANHEQINLIVLLLILGAIYLRIDRFAHVHWPI